ncbi:hypothetical protein BC830DRAFT_1170567 [Chytriomyces sp. MP71]|nr:hypothetical protein BC830DRAFT_1170567 [Chytriomyces sp. MP71]
MGDGDAKKSKLAALAASRKSVEVALLKVMVRDFVNRGLWGELDMSNIITSSRRTRSKKIDFTQFGPDPDDE